MTHRGYCTVTNMDNGIVVGVAVEGSPGYRSMSVDHYDTSGTRWPAGTVYEMLDAGVTCGIAYQDICVSGRTVRLISQSDWVAQ